jgi:hypothetical protein
VLADWHGGEGFARDPSLTSDNYKEKLDAFTWLKQNYGGEVMMLPGDTQAGKWNEKDFIDQFFPGETFGDAVMKAGTNCYNTMSTMFTQAGYPKLLVSTGDHEYGGNGWGPNDTKTLAQQKFRQSFSRGFNYKSASKFRYNTKIGGVWPYPKGTEFATTSFAVRHKNALFITIDAFYNQGPESFFDRQNGLGGEGVITCTVEGKHLKWFEKILKAANKASWCKHIFVQAHLPIAQPVRKVNCSGQFFDEGTDSPFWKLMEEYGVDVYFAGEVHANTATKTKSSNLVQVVSRGNRINNFITVDVSGDVIKLTQYNEIPSSEQASYNLNYEQFGSLTIDKSDPTQTQFDSNGSLEILNLYAATLHYDFDAIHDLDDRQVLGLKDKDKADVLVAFEMTIRGKTVSESIWNKGSFGDQYDAQVGGIKLVDGVSGTAGQFDGTSRMGIFGVGPHGPGNAISLSFWLKTDKSSGNFIIFLYGQSFGNDETSKDIQLITLEKGNIIMHRRSNSRYVPAENTKLADNNWHHIAVSMPFDNCLLSQVEVYIDGKKKDYSVVGVDDYMFHTTSGRCSIAGFGYASDIYEKIFPSVKPFIGFIDEFKLYTRGLTKMDLKKDMKPKKKL